MQIIFLVIAALSLLQTVRIIHAMSALSDKIAAVTADVATLATDVDTALGNAASPADLEALDQAHTDLQAVIARLQPSG